LDMRLWAFGTVPCRVVGGKARQVRDGEEWFAWRFRKIYVLYMSRELVDGRTVCANVGGIEDGLGGFRSGHGLDVPTHGNHDMEVPTSRDSSFKHSKSFERNFFQTKDGGLARLIHAFRLFSPTRFFLNGTTQLIAYTNASTTAITHMNPDQRLSEPCSECIVCSVLH
jgi:hypothetical protein